MPPSRKASMTRLNRFLATGNPNRPRRIATRADIEERPALRATRRRLDLAAAGPNVYRKLQHRELSGRFGASRR